MNVSRQQRLLRIALWAAMAVAVVVRVAYLADKPLWRDEAWVALMVADPAAAIAEGRPAPLGFLLLTRAVTSLGLGPPEISYRLIPLACGLAVLPLLAAWTRMLGASRIAAVAVVWIGAGLAPFVYYSRELKSYDIDLLLAVVAPMLAMAGFRSVAPRPRMRKAFLAIVVVAPWLSFGGIFALCALLAWGWLAWFPAADADARRDWMRCTAGFAASFAAVYAVALAGQADNRWLHSYWQHALGADRGEPLPWKVAAAAWRYASVSTQYLFPRLWLPAVALAVVGAWRWPRPHRAFLVALYVASGAFCVAAAVLDRYLLVHGRLLLFAAPVPLLWCANGLAEVGRGLGRVVGAAGGAGVAIAIPAALSLMWSVEAIGHRTGPYHTATADFFRYDVLHDVDAGIAAAREAMGPGQRLLVSRRCAYAFQFYNDDRISDATYCRRHCGGFQAIASRWLTGIRAKGWILLGDEDVGWLSRLVANSGFRRTPRFSGRGVRLWEVERPAVSQRPRAAKSRARRRPSPLEDWPE